VIVSRIGDIGCGHRVGLQRVLSASMI